MDSKLWSDFKSNFALSQYWHLEIFFFLAYRRQKRDRNTVRLFFRTAAIASHTLSHQEMEQPPFTLKRTRSAPREYGQITATGLHSQTNWKGTQHKMSATCWESRNCSCARQQMVLQTCAVRESNSTALITQVGKLHRSWGKAWEESYENNKKVNRNRKKKKRNLANHLHGSHKSFCH